MQDKQSGGDRVAFVTGASYGLGGATAVGLARDGYDVAVTELRVEDLSDTISKIESLGRRADSCGRRSASSADSQCRANIQR